jgi:hypothetical protein
MLAKISVFVSSCALSTEMPKVLEKSRFFVEVSEGWIATVCDH